MQEFGIVYLLPDEVSVYHRSLRHKIEDAFNLVGHHDLHAPSHITLKYRFQALNIHEIDHTLETFSLSQAKTKWNIKGFNFFQNAGAFVLFMDVVPSIAARQAHNQLLEALKQLDWMQWSPFDNATLHYHITLAHQGLNSQNFDKVWSFLGQIDTPNFELCFDNVALLQINEGVHTVCKKYWLSNDTIN